MRIVLLVAIAAVAVAADQTCVTQSDCPGTHYCPGCMLLGSSESGNATMRTCMPRVAASGACSLADCGSCGDGLSCTAQPFPLGAPITSLPAHCCVPVTCPECPVGVGFARTVKDNCVTSCECDVPGLNSSKACPPNSVLNNCPPCRIDCLGHLLGCGIDCVPRCECSDGYIACNGSCIEYPSPSPPIATTSPPILPGGYEPRSVEDADVRAAAACAIQAINARSDSLYRQTVARVVTASSQVVMGKNFKLTLLIGFTSCLQTAADTANCGLRPEHNDLQLYSVDVAVPLAASQTAPTCSISNFAIVALPATTAPSTPPVTNGSGTGALGSYVTVPITDTAVQDAGKCAIIKLSNALNPQYWFALCRIATAEKQTNNGISYKLGIVLMTSTSPRISTLFSTATCPASATDANKMEKMVVVHYDTHGNCELASHWPTTNLPTAAPVNLATTPATPTAAAATTTPDPPQKNLGGLRPADVESAYVRAAAACAVAYINANSNSKNLLVLANVVSAQVQLVNGLNYYLRFHVALSNCERAPQGQPQPQQNKDGVPCTAVFTSVLGMTAYDIVLHVPLGLSPGAHCDILSVTQLRPYSATVVPPGVSTGTTATPTAAPQPNYLTVPTSTNGVIMLASCGVDALSLKGRHDGRPFFFVSLQTAEMVRQNTLLVYRFKVDVGTSTCAMAARTDPTCLLVKGSPIETYEIKVETNSSMKSCRLADFSKVPLTATSTPALTTSSGGGHWKTIGIVGGIIGAACVLVCLVLLVHRLRRRSQPAKKSYTGFTNPTYNQTPMNGLGETTDDDDDLDWA